MRVPALRCCASLISNSPLGAAIYDVALLLAVLESVRGN